MSVGYKETYLTMFMLLGYLYICLYTGCGLPPHEFQFHSDNPVLDSRLLHTAIRVAGVHFHDLF